VDLSWVSNNKKHCLPQQRDGIPARTKAASGPQGPQVRQPAVHQPAGHQGEILLVFQLLLWCLCVCPCMHVYLHVNVYSCS